MKPLKPRVVDAEQYWIVAPDGEQINIPRELFGALGDFARSGGPTGSIVIHFRNGGVAGLEAILKKIYK
jgi:hypothetical protein